MSGFILMLVMNVVAFDNNSYEYAGVKWFVISLLFVCLFFFFFYFPLLVFFIQSSVLLILFRLCICKIILSVSHVVCPP